MNNANNKVVIPINPLIPYLIIKITATATRIARTAMPENNNALLPYWASKEIVYNLVIS